MNSVRWVMQAQVVTDDAPVLLSESANPDALRNDAVAVPLAHQLYCADKPVAEICHQHGR